MLVAISVDDEAPARLPEVDEEDGVELAPDPTVFIFITYFKVGKGAPVYRNTSSLSLTYNKVY